MNKRSYILLTLSSLLLTSCLPKWESEAISSEEESTPFSMESQKESEETPKEVVFDIISAFFYDEEGHLKVNYTCNYSSPFEVSNHKFSKLNITGVMAKEIDYSNEGYFTLLSLVVDTSLKFEFFDENNDVYLTTRYQNVILYDKDAPTSEEEIQIDYPTGYDTLFWSDEFNADSLNQSNWTYEIGNGNGGWGNNESQYYTDHNEKFEDGYLIISAKKETIDKFNYTSTRIKTQNKVHFAYGYVEARISLPSITGMWPAFWMMPNDSYYGGWPNSGEIDIMEAKGRLTNQSSSALHFSNSDGHTYLSHEKNGHNISEFHKYAVEWKEETIKYFIDDVCHYEISKDQWSTKTVPNSETAPFDKDFYIILNLAVGGHFDGYRLPPEDFTSADMRVDYVRVFR